MTQTRPFDSTWNEVYSCYSDPAPINNSGPAHEQEIRRRLRDDFAYILDTFPVLEKKEKKAFGEFMSKRKCLEGYDRIGKIMNAEG